MTDVMCYAKKKIKQVDNTSGHFKISCNLWESSPWADHKTTAK